MVSRQETARPLLTPGEVMQLPADEALVLAGGCPPVRARKVRYFEDPRLAARVLPPPPSREPRPLEAAPWTAVVAPAAEVAVGIQRDGSGREVMAPQAWPPGPPRGEPGRDDGIPL
jgi:type IV secretion system protein VirD4